VSIAIKNRTRAIGGLTILFAVCGAAAVPERLIGTSAPIIALWRDRGDMHALDLYGGAGGRAHQPPAGVFRFVKEDREGTSPKFDIEDNEGVEWKVKLGEESQAETAATRLLWAAGYFADEDYYVPELRVEGIGKLHRGGKYVFDGGVIHGARLERHIKGQKKAGNWSWFENPYVGTKEFNGLRTLMALVNNWDLKDINNAIYENKGEEGVRYVVTDMGATFGRTGNPLVRSKSNMKEYVESRFIRKSNAESLDLYLKSRPFFLTIFDFHNYRMRTRMEGIAKDIPVIDAKWLGRILGQLTAEQIADCFRAGGYSDAEIEGYTNAVEERIADLNRL